MPWLKKIVSESTLSEGTSVLYRVLSLIHQTQTAMVITLISAVAQVFCDMHYVSTTKQNQLPNNNQFIK